MYIRLYFILKYLTFLYRIDSLFLHYVGCLFKFHVKVGISKEWCKVYIGCRGTGCVPQSHIREHALYEWESVTCGEMLKKRTMNQCEFRLRLWQVLYSLFVMPTHLHSGLCDLFSCFCKDIDIACSISICVYSCL